MQEYKKTITATEWMPLRLQQQHTLTLTPSGAEELRGTRRSLVRFPSFSSLDLNVTAFINAQKCILPDALGLRDVVSGLVKELPGPSARANKVQQVFMGGGHQFDVAHAVRWCALPLCSCIFQVSRAVRKPRVRVQPQQLRRSHRLAGAAAPDMVELDDDGKPLRVSTAQDADEEGGTGLLDLLGMSALTGPYIANLPRG